MKPRPRPQEGDPSRALSEQRLERLAAPLTVLHANIQLLQRRVQRGQVPDPDGLLRVLDKLEQASRTITSELRDMEDAIGSVKRDRAKMTGDRSSVVQEEGKRDT